MNCQVFPSLYEAQLAQKVSDVRALLALPEDMPVSIVPSPVAHYRMRAEFRVWHQGDVWHYAMFDAESKRVVFIDACPMVAESIGLLMPILRAELLRSESLSHRLYAIDLLASTLGEVLVTLIYKKPLDEDWENQVKQLILPPLTLLMGRSRGKKRVLVRDYVNERLSLPVGVGFDIRHVENAFSQPNAKVNEGMLAWVDTQLSSLGRLRAILELYGGAGDFTWVLARHADKVLMTELSQQAVSAAQASFDRAGLTHVKSVALDSKQVSSILGTSGADCRLSWQNECYDFDLVLVDPPRAGLDDVTRLLVGRFDRIVYISCHPMTLVRDCEQWLKTHQVASVAVFDQFPYTAHIEMGVVLVRDESDILVKGGEGC